MSQALRSLILYKRHIPQCHVHKSRIPRKNRRFYFECGCPIYIKGRTPAGDLVPKQALITGRLENAPFEKTVEVPHSSSNVIYIALPANTSVAQVKIYETGSGDSQVGVCYVRPIVRR